MITKFIGILAAACFAFCGVPAAWYAWYDGESQPPIHVSLPILIGASAMYFYLCATFGWDLLLFVSYVVEIGSWAIIVRFNFWPRKPL